MNQTIQLGPDCQQECQMVRRNLVPSWVAGFTFVLGFVIGIIIGTYSWMR